MSDVDVSDIINTRFADPKHRPKYRPIQGKVSMRGRVKWFNDSKGFGVITSGSGEDLFVHYSAISTGSSAEAATGLARKGQDSRRSLKPGQEVEFDMYEGEKEPLARNVMRLL
jgi:CspA family cold shock protein